MDVRVLKNSSYLETGLEKTEHIGLILLESHISGASSVTSPKVF